MSAVAYVDFVAAQCLVSISNRSAVPEAARLKVPGEGEAARELRDPRDAWKDYCALLAIAKSLLELNKYRPLPAPSVCSDSVESPDEDAGSDSDAATEPGSSPPRSPPPGPPPRLRAAGDAPKGKLAAEKRHKCPYSGCGKVYGKSSHLKAHYRVHTVVVQKGFQPCLNAYSREPRNLFIKKKNSPGSGWLAAVPAPGSGSRPVWLPLHPSALTKDQHRHEASDHSPAHGPTALKSSPALTSSPGTTEPTPARNSFDAPSARSGSCGATT
ncbi:Krueppel-like factor 9 isoform X2 [Falco naumanni]|uniref:Krueppel-like factor 9 isoform X2 n=1 Tax=Falco naumanni TaxID=148594 RepID=UPI001ADE779A|nr:Krueppel-like factor 9 isoform X2 [Falco naumanni]